MHPTCSQLSTRPSLPPLGAPAPPDGANGPFPSPLSSPPQEYEPLSPLWLPNPQVYTLASLSVCLLGHCSPWGAQQRWRGGNSECGWAEAPALESLWSFWVFFPVSGWHWNDRTCREGPLSGSGPATHSRHYPSHLPALPSSGMDPPLHPCTLPAHHAS